MLNWKNILQDYIIKHSDRIRKTTKPLRDHFGTSYFTYHRIDNSGKYTVLVDRPDWAEHYVDRQLFLDDPYLKHPSTYQSGISLIGSLGSKKYKESILQDGKKILNMDLGAVLIQKSDNFVEFFGLCANKEKSSLEDLYLNHPTLLKSFASHFKKELTPILTQMEQENFSLIDLKGQGFFNPKEPPSQSITPATTLAYLDDLGMRCEIEKAKKLSLRERQCLKLLIADKSAKETASILGLSSRTVEHYFENIKNKLSCWSKHEVLQIAKNLESLELL